MSVVKSILAASAIAFLMATVDGHMVMSTPKPYGSPNNSPLAADGSDFPCKATSNAGAPVTDMAIGAPQSLSFTGSAVHGGGSCQIALTSDSPATKDSKWMVIHSIEGGCPASGVAGNLPENPDGSSANTFKFTIPEGIAPASYTLAWTWFNKIGNREMYMNCASVKVSGGSGKRDEIPLNETMGIPELTERETASFPPLFLANIPATDCTTVEAADLQFPDPGASVEKDGSGKLAPPTGPKCGASSGGASSGGASSGGASSGGAPSGGASSGGASSGGASSGGASSGGASSGGASSGGATPGTQAPSAGGSGSSGSGSSGAASGGASTPAVAPAAQAADGASSTPSVAPAADSASSTPAAAPPSGHAKGSSGSSGAASGGASTPAVAPAAQAADGASSTPSVAPAADSASSTPAAAPPSGHAKGSSGSAAPSAPSSGNGVCTAAGQSVCSPDGLQIGECSASLTVVWIPVASRTKCSGGFMVHARSSPKFHKGYVKRGHVVGGW